MFWLLNIQSGECSQQILPQTAKKKTLKKNSHLSWHDVLTSYCAKQTSHHGQWKGKKRRKDKELTRVEQNLFNALRQLHPMRRQQPTQTTSPWLVAVHSEPGSIEESFSLVRIQTVSISSRTQVIRFVHWQQLWGNRLHSILFATFPSSNFD